MRGVGTHPGGWVPALLAFNTCAFFLEMEELWKQELLYKERMIRRSCRI